MSKIEKSEKNDNPEIPAQRKLHGRVGVCPLCGSENIDYGASILQDFMLLYQVKCNDCHTKFTEMYELTYCCKWEIEDPDGNQINVSVE